MFVKETSIAIAEKFVCSPIPWLLNSQIQMLH